MDQSGNGTLNISTFKQGGGYGNIRIQGNGGNLGVGPLGAGYPLTVSGTSGAADIAYFCSSGAANTNIKLDTQNTGYQTNLTFYSANVFKWQLGKNTDDSFFIYNSTGVANMTIYASSNAVIFNGGGSGNLGIGSYNLPAAKLDITGPTGSSTFTTSSYLGFVVRPGANGNYGGIDFTSPWGGADNPLARIALVAGSSGSFLNIGTSNNYNNGITSPGLAIDYLGYVAIGGKPIPGTGSFTSRFAIYNGLSNYANNAAALAGGLVAGDVYRNGDVMQIVH
jgi:hypothetical protein